MDEKETEKHTTAQKLNIRYYCKWSSN